MAQQTAVDWLMDRFLFAGYGLPTEWREQAKQMEKEQIMKAVYNTMEFDPNVEAAEKYYNKTYVENKD